MKSCNHCRALLGDYLDGTLSASDRDAVAAHLEKCADCRREMEELTIARRALQSWTPVAAPAELRLRIRAAVENEPKRKQGFDWVNGFSFLRPQKLAWGGAVTFSAIALLLMTRPYMENPTLLSSATKPEPKSNTGGPIATRDSNGGVSLPKKSSASTKHDQPASGASAKRRSTGTLSAVSPATPPSASENSPLVSPSRNAPFLADQTANLSSSDGNAMASSGGARSQKKSANDSPPRGRLAPSTSRPVPIAPPLPMPLPSEPQEVNNNMQNMAPSVVTPPSTGRKDRTFFDGKQKSPVLNNTTSNGVITLAGRAENHFSIGITASDTQAIPEVNKMSARSSAEVNGGAASSGMRTFSPKVVVPNLAPAAAPVLVPSGSPTVPPAVQKQSDNMANSAANAGATGGAGLRQNRAVRGAVPNLPGGETPAQGGFGGRGRDSRDEDSPRSLSRVKAPNVLNSVAVAPGDFQISVTSLQDFKGAQIRVALPVGLHFAGADLSSSRVIWRGDFQSGQVVKVPLSLLGVKGGEKISVFLEQNSEPLQSKQFEMQSLTLPEPKK